jgi:hypothetical protein
MNAIGCVVLLTLAAAALPSTPSSQTRALPATAARTAALSGIAVVSTASGDMPARRARVTLTTSDPFGGHTAIADDNGRFTFTALPADRYTLTARKDGFLAAVFGALRPGGPGTPIVIAAGQRVTGIVLRLQPAASVSGTLTDRHGEPISQTRVAVYRLLTTPSVRRLDPLPTTVTTDERGVYRMSGLVAGSYIVMAIPATEPELLREIADGDVQSAIAATQPPQPGIRAIMPPSRLNPAPAAKGSNVMSSPIFYPGTAAPSDALPVDVEAGEERTGIDFVVKAAAAVSVSGQIFAPDSSLQGTQVTLSITPIDPAPPMFTRTVTVRMSEVGGTFALPAVSPGHYRADVRTRTHWGRTEIYVGESDVTTADISLQRSLTLTGRLAFDRGAGVRTPTLASLAVRLVDADDGARPAGLAATIRGDGSFDIRGIAPGRYLVTATDPEGWLLKSAVIGGRDAADIPIEIAPDTRIENAVVTFTNRATQVTGRLQAAGGRPVSEYSVVIFPADRSLWMRGSRRNAVTRPGTDGEFVVAGLPAGAYIASLAADVSDLEVGDPAFFEALAGRGVKFTLADGEKKVQNLRVGG